MNRKLVLGFFMLLFYLQYAATYKVDVAQSNHAANDSEIDLNHPLTQNVADSSMVKPSNYLLTHNLMTLEDNVPSFTPVIVNVQVLYPDNQPMSNVMVVAINHEYYFRLSEKTNASGWVTFKAMSGNWSFFAYPEWVKAIADEGTGYLPFKLEHHLNCSMETLILKPDTKVDVYLNSFIEGFNFLDGKTDLIVVENSIAWIGPLGTTGVPKNNKLTLWTQKDLVARISLSQPAELEKPGILFVTKPISFTPNLSLNISDANVGKVAIQYQDIYGNLAYGHVQFSQLERSWYKTDYYDQFGNVTYFMSPSNVSIFIAVDMYNGSDRYRIEFNRKSLKPTIGSETTIHVGGPLESKILVTPKPDIGWKLAHWPATQLMVYMTDSFENVVYRVLGPTGNDIKPRISITADGGRVTEANDSDIGRCFVSMIREEFEPFENPRYNITYDFGPFGQDMVEGLLYDPEAIKMSVSETTRLLCQSPAIDSTTRNAQTESYESLFGCMEELIGVPTDYKIGVISNILWAGFEDEILHGFKLELAHEVSVSPEWLLGDDFIGHEIGHGRIHKPPTRFGMIRDFGEAYATLVGYKARACLFGDEKLFDFFIGRHDLFLKRLHGTPLNSSGDYIEMVQFITYYIDKNFGWEAHKRMILEWENSFCPLRDILSTSGFTDTEQMASIYSYIVGHNLAPLFALCGFEVTKDRVNSAIDLIIQDQQQTGNDELKIGEATAVTQTVSVPIILRRVSGSLNGINLTLTFDPSLARVLQIYKRDLTSNDDWNLKAISDTPGQLTIQLQGSHSIANIGSIAQVNFEVAFTNKSELQLAFLQASTDSGNRVVTEGGRIILSQLLPTRPKNLPFEIVWNEETFYIIMSSNSTIKNFEFDQANKTLSFSVTAPMGTTGFCNISIPKELLSGNFSVYKDNALLTKYVEYTETFNGTHYIFYIEYTHSSHAIQIKGTGVIPEFPSFLLLPVFILTTLLAIIIYRKQQLP